MYVPLLKYFTSLPPSTSCLLIFQILIKQVSLSCYLCSYPCILYDPCILNFIPLPVCDTAPQSLIFSEIQKPWKIKLVLSLYIWTNLFGGKNLTKIDVNLSIVFNPFDSYSTHTICCRILIGLIMECCPRMFQLHFEFANILPKCFR